MAKSPTRSSWVSTTCGITATWDPSRTAAVSTQCASRTEPAPSSEDRETIAVGWTTVA